MTTPILKKDFDVSRVARAAEFVRDQLAAYLEADLRRDLRDADFYKDGITQAEMELATIRALAVLVLDGTSRMFRFEREAEFAE